MRLALGVDYHGAGFQGWQRQREGKTVQQSLEEAISKIANHDVSVVASGRTDTGVHALGQVIHVDVRSERSQHQWLLGINRYLPDSIAVRWVCEVDDSFHARFSALQRRYVYLLNDNSAPSALRAAHMTRYYRQVSIEAMQAAAKLLCGEHDFSAFRGAQCQAKSPVRTVSHCEVYPLGDCLVIDIAANAFLHHMVRNVVGSLLQVGYGDQPVAWIGELLSSGDRASAGEKMSPQGLYLLEVLYPQQYDLPCPEQLFFGLDFSCHALRHQ